MQTANPTLVYVPAMPCDSLSVLERGSDAAHVVVVAAHMDDETLGAGTRLPSLGRLTIIHVTDGAPRNLSDASKHGFTTQDQYAEERQNELHRALSELHAEHATLIALGIPDQEAAFSMSSLTRRLCALFDQLNPDVVLTHPYEGGHPDHDACAFAVNTAARLCRSAPAVVEFASYHAAPQGIRTGEFLNEEASDSIWIPLQEAAQALKKRALDCFRTQRETLALFHVNHERFRMAPGYDFTASPHPGQLYYERFDWGMTGDRFRKLAASALRDLNLTRAA